MKRGISLIAVLMFMLAATTSSIVLYKWLGSENFASGARLKHSEAYQASESGFDAVRAWLSFKAADVGDVLRQHFTNDKMPYRLDSNKNNVLGGFNNEKQNFRVYLLGADTTKKPYKLKFMSIGTGRDGSEVKQTAIFNVEGLYNLKIPLSREGTTFNDDFYGKGNFGNIESMNVVIKQTPKMVMEGGQALNTITIGDKNKNIPGYLILDGNYYVNSGMNIYGDAYVTGNFDFCPKGRNDEINGYLYIGGNFHPKGALTIWRDAFFNGEINPNTNINDDLNLEEGTGGCKGQADDGVVHVKENSTIRGNFVYYNNDEGGSLGFHVDGNLVMDGGTVKLTRQENNTDSLSVYKNVYIKNPLEGQISKNNFTKPIPFFGKNPFTVCVGGPWLPSSVPIGSGWWSWHYEIPGFAENPPPYERIRIRTGVSTIETPAVCNYAKWGADTLNGTGDGRDLKKKLEEGGINENNNEDCKDNTPIKFDMNIYYAVKKDNPSAWVHRLDKPGNCATVEIDGKKVLKLADPASWYNLGEELQACKTHTPAPSVNLYKDEWLVIYMKNKVFFNSGGSLSDGKYIIILDITENVEKNRELPLPPTGNAQVMLYLPHGYPNKIKLAGSTGDRFNYFIFSDGDIGTFVTNGNKLTGNVFMNNCSTMNTLGEIGEFKSTSDPLLVEALMDDEILQENEDGACKGDDCEKKSSSSTVKTEPDKNIIPLSPRLKVELESKYISKEKEPKENEAEYVKQNILVMPRLLRLPSNAFSQPGITLSSYYNLLYLNGATKPESADATKPTPSCTCIGNPCTSGAPMNTSSPAAGIYKCELNEKISNFYVRIGTPSTNIPSPPNSSTESP
jgi:hypothetical protein